MHNSCGGDIPRPYPARHSGVVTSPEPGGQTFAILWFGWAHQPANNSWVDDVPFYYSARYSGDIAQNDIYRAWWPHSDILWSWVTHTSVEPRGGVVSNYLSARYSGDVGQHDIATTWSSRSTPYCLSGSITAPRTTSGFGVFQDYFIYTHWKYRYHPTHFLTTWVNRLSLIAQRTTAGRWYCLQLAQQSHRSQHFSSVLTIFSCVLE